MTLRHRFRHARIAPPPAWGETFARLVEILVAKRAPNPNRARAIVKDEAAWFRFRSSTIEFPSAAMRPRGRFGINVSET
jgi:hypothetical protein